MIVLKKWCIKGLFWVWMMVFEFDLVVCDGFIKVIEDEEVGGCSVLVDVVYELLFVGFIFGLVDVMR